MKETPEPVTGCRACEHGVCRHLAEVCKDCGKPAACFGSYEGRPPAPACDDCCGHGNEDGYCERVARAETPCPKHGGCNPRDCAYATLKESLNALISSLNCTYYNLVSQEARELALSTVAKLRAALRGQP